MCASIFVTSTRRHACSGYSVLLPSHTPGERGPRISKEALAAHQRLDKLHNRGHAHDLCPHVNGHLGDGHVHVYLPPLSHSGPSLGLTLDLVVCFPGCRLLLLLVSSDGPR